MTNFLSPSRTQLEALVGLTQGAAGLLDRDARVLYLTTSLLGYSVDSLYGRSVFEAMEPDDVPESLAQFQRCLEQPGIPVRTQVRKLHSDGSKRILEVVMLNKLADPEVQAIVLQYRDVTAVQAIEERDAVNRERLAILSEVTHLLAESFDSSNVLQKLATSTAARFADYCIVYRRRQNGALVRAAISHGDPKQAEAMARLAELPILSESMTILNAVIDSGQPRLVEELTPQLLNTIPPGQFREAMLRLNPKSTILVPLIARGRRMGALALVLTTGDRRYTTDDFEFVQELAQRAAIAIDNERLYREAQEATRLRDYFLATVSHELRTPITAIAGWASVLRKADVPAATFRKALESIERNIKIQTSLIDDLMDGARIVSGKMGLNVKTADLVAIVTSVVDNMRVSAEAKGIQIVCDIKLKTANTVCDPARVEQMIWNLLSNAIKFTPAQGRISVAMQPAGEAATEIIITDSGLGIADDFLPHVFEQFRQYDDSNSRRTSGLGLGLSIVKHLVDLHGGTILAESEGIGKGATFRVVLPGKHKFASTRE